MHAFTIYRCIQMYTDIHVDCMCVRPKARQKVPPVSAADVLLDDVAMWLAPMQATDAVLTTYAPLVSAQPYAAEHCLIVACPRDGRARAARCTLYVVRPRPHALPMVPLRAAS
jgi:hypothetical protein